jgi:hypothetical protein
VFDADLGKRLDVFLQLLDKFCGCHAIVLLNKHALRIIGILEYWNTGILRDWNTGIVE